ncbi:hypothetical protein BX666DRAFT_1866553 [Dichotomocladium elegans]|nr:hypothetical protein BX666DRAFT_1866553 [Dichotomocladium elegans]
MFSPATATLPVAGDDHSSSSTDEFGTTSDDEPDETLVYAHNQSILASPNIERIEWQQMLQSVLMGEVIKSEKKRLLSSDQLKQQKPTPEIWLSIRALLRGRILDEERKFLEEGRREIDGVLQMIEDFSVKTNSDEDALTQVAEALKTVDRVESLYSTRADMIDDNPKYASPGFQSRLDALNAWCTITRSLVMQHKILHDWTGSENLIIAAENKEISFVERILKESALQDTFEKRTLSALYLLLVKSKNTMATYHQLFAEMNLPSFIPQLRYLATFPTSLVKEALKLRLEYKDRINEAPKPMVDTMMEDYRGLLTLACRVKLQYEELAEPAPGWDLKDETFIDEEFDTTLVESVRFYFKLIAWKMQNEKENTLKECDVLEKEWDFLKSTVCQAVEKVDWECAEQFCSFTNRLLTDLMTEFVSGLQLTDQDDDSEKIEFKYTEILHAIRMRARKLLQFSKQVFFLGQFENAAEYIIDSEDTNDFIRHLWESGHFLVITDTFEEERIYIIASPSLYGREEAISPLIRSSFQREPLFPLTPSTPGTTTADQFEDYIIAFSPWQNLVWKGDAIHVPVPFVHMGIKARRARLVTSDTRRLHSAKSKFLSAFHNLNGISVIQEHRANIPKVNKELLKIKNTVMRLAKLTIDSVRTIRMNTQNMSCQELVEECFSFASDFGIRAARFLDTHTRQQLDLMLIRLAIDWICFITDECTPSDRKTFRWAVAALEFGHLMTRGVNILALDDDEFSTFQIRVARCIALLISHFDVLGTRWRELEVREQRQRKRGVTAKRNSYMTSNKRASEAITTSSFGVGNDAISGAAGVTFIRDEWMRNIMKLEDARNTKERESKIIGRVLEDQKPEDQSILYLAPSASNISFRWQQGRFIGSGTFGNVYLAINLDTSSMMAVKEIRFPDSSSLSALHKAIKEEMKVMEMLNHANVVQYFGMEVHRDKVYIFMEYCENGSLGALLEHGGRIEDEFYIANYAYQLLKGLAYLHENNIVHRDIKPDNILIDYQGVLKLSDFGAAKILAKGQKTMGRTTVTMNVNSLAGTPMFMAPEVITGGETGRKGSMDIWSLACCIVQMATGRRPWSTLENEWSVMYHVVTGHPPLPDSSQLSQLGIDFLKKCFTRNPTKRPTAQELLSHPWITSYQEESIYPEGERNAEYFMEKQDQDPSNIPDENNMFYCHPHQQISNGDSNSYRDESSTLIRSIPNSLAMLSREEVQVQMQNYAASQTLDNMNGNDRPLSRSSSLFTPSTSVNIHDFGSWNRRSSAASYSTTTSLVRSVDENEIISRPASPL